MSARTSAQLCDAAGTAQVPLPDLSHGGNFGKVSLARNRDGETFQLITLDSLDLDSVKPIKTGVEGMEANLLRGAQKLIAKGQPVIFLENNIPDKSAQLIQLLRDLGYRCRWHLAGYYNRMNFYSNTRNIFATVDQPEINMLCLPDKVEAAIKSLVPVTGPEDTWQSALARSTAT